MALRKNLAHRFLSFCRPSSAEALAGRSRAAGYQAVQKLRDSTATSEEGFLRRVLLQSRGIVESSSASSGSLERLPLPVGNKLLERLRSINGDRIRLDMLHPPVQIPIPPDRKEEKTAEAAPSISVEEARKILRLSMTEVVKARLRETGKSSIPYSEFVRICCEGSGQLEQGLSLARALDESGAVLVLGNVVFLRPDQVAKAIERVIPQPLLSAVDGPQLDELRELERQKAEIDSLAKAGVRRELWGGLAYLVLQTAAFMRLTFWELSWDVMEPICFYVTSIYFMAGYTFFLRTSRDPSFEGFFESRFASKQRRLMQAAKFDLARFKELRRVFPPAASSPPPPMEFFSPLPSSLLPFSSAGHRHHDRDNFLGSVN
ncbi:unnamed protein product [Spirodela intermedia]|uniref:Calcium uniporter protein C-terminal domain-containing protein n=1 Tax=Spirodela intermedia TaxID=51605 RepID=A0A7I8K883_SPIIN|nr:unnamed protein product [Spirodela intermedia]